MSNRTFIVIVVVVLAFLELAVAFHTPQGAGVVRSLRALHGG